MSHTHIIIIGGGIIGLTLANLLANNNHHITLIDQGPPPTAGLKTPYDTRVAAINHSSEHIFQTLNIWQAITQLRASPYQKIHVWDEKSPGYIDFDCADVGRCHLGHIIEHSVMKQALYQPLLNQANIHLCYNTTPVALQEMQDSIILSLNTGELLETKLLVGADGGNSWVAQHSGLAIHTKPYQQSALVTTLHTEKPHRGTAMQRFLTNGPLAFLPLADAHHTSIVWSTLPGHANHLCSLSETSFNQTLADAFEHRLGQVTVQNKRVAFPLVERHALRYTRSRVALVGDAAHTIHPLAGQGMNLGLLDAAALAGVLIDAADPGKLAVLRRYERQRKSENASMIYTMAAFKQIFGSTAALPTHARALGLWATNQTPLIKNYFMKQAMGLPA